MPGRVDDWHVLLLYDTYPLMNACLPAYPIACMAACPADAYFHQPNRQPCNSCSVLNRIYKGLNVWLTDGSNVGICLTEWMPERLNPPVRMSERMTECLTERIRSPFKTVWMPERFVPLCLNICNDLSWTNLPGCPTPLPLYNCDEMWVPCSCPMSYVYSSLNIHILYPSNTLTVTYYILFPVVGYLFI